MNFIYKNKFVITAIFIVIIILAYYFIRDYRASKTLYQSRMDDEYISIPKTYGVNEYVIVDVSNDTLVKNYFSNFKSIVQKDIDKSYLKLNEEYRNKRFSNIDDYKNYIRGLDLNSAKPVKYNVISDGEYKIYIVYDNRNNFYAFKVKGVMQYTLYLDDYTVEIRWYGETKI